jgi:hypothetical protein
MLRAGHRPFLAHAALGARSRAGILVAAALIAGTSCAAAVYQPSRSRGFALDAATDPDAGVSIRRPDGSTVDVNGAGWMGMGQTDSAGKFETNTLDGTFNVVVTHANHPRKTAGPVVVTPGQVTEFIVTLEAGYSVTVAVKDANGAVVVDATVELIDAAGNPVIPSGWASLFGGIKTDAAGTAAITGVGAGTYSVRVTRVVPGKAPLVESVGSVTVSSHDENAAVVVAPLALEPGDGDY